MGKTVALLHKNGSTLLWRKSPSPTISPPPIHTFPLYNVIVKIFGGRGSMAFLRDTVLHSLLSWLGKNYVTPCLEPPGISMSHIPEGFGATCATLHMCWELSALLCRHIIRERAQRASQHPDDIRWEDGGVPNPEKEGPFESKNVLV